MSCIAGYQEIAMTAVELAVTVGIMEAAIKNNEDLPEYVSENFDAKVQEIVEQLHGEIIEFQNFAEHFDRGDNSTP